MRLLTPLNQYFYDSAYFLKRKNIFITIPFTVSIGRLKIRDEILNIPVFPLEDDMKGYKITRDKFLASEEVRQVMVATEEKAIADQYKGRKVWVTRFAVVHLAFFSGLRVSEIAALKIGDIYLNNRNPFLIVQCGKGGRKRDVYIDKDLLKHLRDYIETKEKAWGEKVDSDAPLFSGIPDKQYTTTALHLSFKRAMENAGLSDKCSIHGARHTYATQLLEKCKNIRFVQKQLGHASLNMTALYADVLPEKNASYANAILD